MLRTPDSNTAGLFAVTYDMGALPATGSLDDFDGLVLQGDWTLTIDKTDGRKNRQDRTGYFDEENNPTNKTP